MIDDAAVQAEVNRGYRILLEALGRLAIVLERDDVVEVYCNSNDLHVWVEYVGSGRTRSDLVLSPDDRKKIIQTVASFCKTIANKENPIISAELPKFGYRFEASLPDISLLPSFNIRKPAKVVFTLADYVRDGILNAKQEAIIKLAVHKKMNILIGGGTGSGKTTLCNAILEEISKTGDRLVILEDTRELNCTALDYEAFRTSFTVTMNMLLRTTMRRRPDRIIVGEVRDGAAYDLLKAWNTGHPGGVSTTHANDVLESLKRIAALSLEAGGGSSAPPLSVVNSLIGSTVNLVVFITRASRLVNGKMVKGRLVKQLGYLKGYDAEKGNFIIEYDEDEILNSLNNLIV